MDCCFNFVDLGLQFSILIPWGFDLNKKKKGGPVHEAPANAGSGEGKMHAALPPFLERLFP